MTRSLQYDFFSPFHFKCISIQSSCIHISETAITISPTTLSLLSRFLFLFSLLPSSPHYFHSRPQRSSFSQLKKIEIASISNSSSVLPLSVTVEMPSITLNYGSLLSLSLKDVRLKNQTLQIPQLTITADSSSILQCSPIVLSLIHTPSHSFSSWDIIEHAWTELPRFWEEAKYIELPDEWLSKPYSNYFYSHPAANCVECDLPSLQLKVDRVAMVSVLKIVSSFLCSDGISSLQFPSVVSYSPPDWEFQISCPFLSLSIQNDVVCDEDTDGEFCSIDLDTIDLNMKWGSQQLDLLTSFKSLSFVSRFQHIARPLMLETLTGYDNSVETTSWENACQRYNELKNGMTELLAISSSSIHFIQRPHVVPTGNARILTDYLHSCKTASSLSSMQTLSFGNSYTVQATLGVIQIDLDDVCVSDLVHGVLTIADFILIDREEKNLWKCDEYEFQNSFLCCVTSPFLSLDLSYNQKSFQNLTAPSISFEFGFPRHFQEGQLMTRNFECGANCAGIFWTDYTTDYITHSVGFWNHNHSQILQSRHLPGIQNDSDNGMFSVEMCVSWRQQEGVDFPVIEVVVENAAFSLLVRQMLEIAKSVRFRYVIISYFFGSFYPLLQQILNPSTPHQRSFRLLSSPLTQSFFSTQLSPIYFHQSPLSSEEYEEFVRFYPLIECRARNLAIILPHETSDSRGIVVDLKDIVISTHKVRMPSIPSGTLLRTGFFPAALQHRIRRGNENTTDLWNSGLFQLIDSTDDSLVFPRFLVNAWNIRLYSTYSDQIIADGITLKIQFRQSVVFPNTNIPDPTQFPSETHLLKYDRYMATHIPAEIIPNSGLPMEVSVTVQECSLNLLSSQYSDCLLFFFLNLAELPTVCVDSSVPVCSKCHWAHEYVMGCGGCWCVMSVVLNKCMVRPIVSNTKTTSVLGMMRCDQLQLCCYLHNIVTHLSIIIPTIFLSDSVHITIFPDNLNDYHHSIPIDRNYNLSIPALVLTDTETMTQRNLSLTLSHFLVNLRPRYFLLLYTWLTDPLWATYDLPQSATWPAKIGNYKIHCVDLTTALMRSTSLPEEDIVLSDELHPANTTLFRMRTNSNRMCVAVRIHCEVNCVMDANKRTMDCECDVTVKDIQVTRFVMIYDNPHPASILDMRAFYRSEPVDETPTSPITSVINLSFHKSEIILMFSDIPEIVGILCFQLQNATSYLSAAPTINDQNDFYYEEPKPLNIERRSIYTSLSTSDQNHAILLPSPIPTESEVVSEEYVMRMWLSFSDESEDDTSEAPESPKDEAEVLRGRTEIRVDIDGALPVWFQGNSLPLLSFCVSHLKAGLNISGVCVFHFSLVFL